MLFAWNSRQNAQNGKQFLVATHKPLRSKLVACSMQCSGEAFLVPPRLSAMTRLSQGDFSSRTRISALSNSNPEEIELHTAMVIMIKSPHDGSITPQIHLSSCTLTYSDKTLDFLGCTKAAYPADDAKASKLILCSGPHGRMPAFYELQIFTALVWPNDESQVLGIVNCFWTREILVSGEMFLFWSLRVGTERGDKPVSVLGTSLYAVCWLWGRGGYGHETWCLSSMWSSFAVESWSLSEIEWPSFLLVAELSLSSLASTSSWRLYD